MRRTPRPSGPLQITEDASCCEPMGRSRHWVHVHHVSAHACVLRFCERWNVKICITSITPYALESMPQATYSYVASVRA
jgi:hypothetical protein